jgi:hypothetical protein
MTSKPGRVIGPGAAREKPAYGSGGVRHEGGVSPIQALVRNVGTWRSDEKGRIQVGGPDEGARTEAEHRDGVTRSSDDARESGWSEGVTSSSHEHRSTGDGRNRVSVAKPFRIPKRDVWEAYVRVKANQGAAGVDAESLEDFEADLKNNLYRIWNRMSSGTYFPPPVRQVVIPKRDGGERKLGIPTVADRIAQTVVKRYLELLVSRDSTPTPMDTGPESRRCKPSDGHGNAAGDTAGFSILISEPSLTRWITPSS